MKLYVRFSIHWLFRGLRCFSESFGVSSSLFFDVSVHIYPLVDLHTLCRAFRQYFWKERCALSICDIDIYQNCVVIQMFFYFVDQKYFFIAPPVKRASNVSLSTIMFFSNLFRNRYMYSRECVVMEIVHECGCIVSCYLFENVFFSITIVVHFYKIAQCSILLVYVFLFWIEFQSIEKIWKVIKAVLGEISAIHSLFKTKCI